MSVHVSAYVWEHSRHSGTELLLLLAIADIANREGLAWPAVKTLGRMMRMSERNTRRILRELEASGELLTRQGAGPSGCHLYQVKMIENLPLFGPDEPVDKPVDSTPPDKLSGDKRDRRGRTSRVKRDDIAMSAEPSVTNYRTAAARGSSPGEPVDKSKAAAAAGGKLLYPPNLSSAQQHAMESYLKGLSPRAAQLLLDELAGLLKAGMNGKAVRDPMAVFAVLARQNDDGKFVPSHAHRIQAEREAIT